MPVLRSFRAHQLTAFQVITEQIDASTVVDATGDGDGRLASLAGPLVA
ncbi:hypothetical protein NZK32_08535 [Cyanobium sp. FGCU-52]|nr:hypothetical protein [Cyanobium sp. FGCU52]